MAWEKDITGVDTVNPGTFRSLNGAADESIFQGRASKAGFYCFFKVWRDMPYDAVLDYKGILYRIEVKGSSGGTFDVTRGARSGRQIARGTSRKRMLSREDCDFAVGVDSNTGDCYIIPEDVIQIMGLNNISTKSIEDFKEKWGLFTFLTQKNILTAEQVRDGLMKADMTELQRIAGALNIIVPQGDLKIEKTRVVIKDQGHKMIYLIWKKIAEKN